MFFFFTFLFVFVWFSLSIRPTKITREMLNDKISELNSAIDGVSAQLQSSSSKGNANNPEQM